MSDLIEFKVNLNLNNLTLTSYSDLQITNSSPCRYNNGVFYDQYFSCFLHTITFVQELQKCFVMRKR